MKRKSLSIVLTLNEWIKTIHSQITSFSHQANDIRIHKEKLSTLLIELKSFNQKTANKKYSESLPNPTETNMLRSVMTLLDSIRILMDSCQESKMIETLIDQEVNDPLNILNKFRAGFNQFIKNLKILDNEACTCDGHQLSKDNINDSKTIVDIINQYFHNNKAISKESKEILEKRLQEYQNIINNSQQVYEDENDEDREISEAEYLKIIQEISDCFVDPNDFKQNEKIGEGGFGTVFSGIQKSTGKVVAIKQLRAFKFKVSDLKSLIYEVSIMSKIRHYGILPLVGYIYTKPYSIITEFMSGGTLKDRLFSNNAKRLDGTRLTIIALGIAYAMKFIHMKKYIHRDLKPDNVMLDADDYPCVIDFGLSRLLPKNEEDLLTFGKGTLSYMAPELLGDESGSYGPPIDVYAYGVTLWVMLTGQHPYSTRLPMFQLIRRVTSGERPKIPSTAGTIGPLIEKCWSKDANDRPTFEEIVTILETGEVFFPGTNTSQVNSYKNIYKKKTGEIKKPQKVVEGPPEKIHEVDVSEIQTQLESVKLDASNLAIEKIERNINNSGFLEKLLKKPKFLQSLLNSCDKCDSLVVAQKIISIFTAILKLPKSLNQQSVAKVLGLFVKFGSTEMTEILEFLDSFPNSELQKIKLSANQLNKFASFLKHSDVSLRVGATNILIKIIKNNCYSSVDSLKTNLTEIISNIISSVSSMPNLLLASLTVVNLLLPFKELHNIFIEGHIFTLTISVFNYDQKSNGNIFKEACEVLKKIIKIFRGKINEIDLANAIISLQLASKYCESGQLVNYIVIFVNLLELNAFYSVIEKDEENRFANCFETFLKTSKSDESIALLLKVCYSLLNDKATHDCLASISSTYLNFIINSKNTKMRNLIQSVATCCLIQSINDKNIESVITNDLKKFIKASLQSKQVQNESTLNALRLCSGLSSRRKGTECLLKDNIIELIEFYLKSNNKITVKLAVMIYSSFSAIYPGSDKIISCVPTVLKMMNNKEYYDLLPYISSFISNASISSEGAIQCAQNISDISNALNNLCSKVDIEKKNDKTFIVYKIISTLINIVVCQNAFECISNSKDFTIICKAAKQPFCDDLLGCFLDLFARISRTKLGTEAIQNSNLSSYLKGKMNDLKPNDFRRARILRLLAVSP